MDRELKGCGTNDMKKGCAGIVDLLEQARAGWASRLCSRFYCHSFGKLLISGSEDTSHGHGSSHLNFNQA